MNCILIGETSSVVDTNEGLSAIKASRSFYSFFTQYVTNWTDNNEEMQAWFSAYFCHGSCSLRFREIPGPAMLNGQIASVQGGSQDMATGKF